MDMTFRTIRVRPGVSQEGILALVRALLAGDGLRLDGDVTAIVTAYDREGTLVGCAGLARDVVKCVAIHTKVRGEGLALPLMTEIVALAWEQGQKDLFLYTKPENEALFTGCGFMALAAVPHAAVLMENNKRRLADYTAALAAEKKPGQIVAGLVMNCNPFTLGHQYLVQEAARCTDWVHLFVVREDCSFFPYEARLGLVREGVAHIPNVTVHPGSVYCISRATFPAYFLKDAAAVDTAHTGIDIQIFRKYIAPALGITHRFVGTEPHSAVTKRYNDDMAYWLAASEVDAPAIVFTELPRMAVDGEAVSASRVRALWAAGGLEAVRTLVPASTFTYLESHPEMARAFAALDGTTCNTEESTA